RVHPLAQVAAGVVGVGGQPHQAVRGDRLGRGLQVAVAVVAVLRLLVQGGLGALQPPVAVVRVVGRVQVGVGDRPDRPGQVAVPVGVDRVVALGVGLLQQVAGRGVFVPGEVALLVVGLRHLGKVLRIAVLDLAVVGVGDEAQVAALALVQVVVVGVGGR